MLSFRLLPVVAFFLLQSSSSAQPTISFDAPPRDHVLPSTPNTGVAGDFNGDGFPDIAAIGDFGITILPGKGNGTFGRPITTSIEDGGYLAVVAGDFNGDGILDLAATSQVPPSIVVFLGNGHGRFVAQPVVPVSVSSASLAACDLNNDGFLDLVIATNTTVTVLLGNGNATFAPALTTTVSGGAQHVQVGDFNRDGNLDVVVQTNGSSENLLILLGKGDGTFLLGASYYAANLGALAVGDVNNDGSLDLVAVADENVVRFLGNGDGTFNKHSVVSGVEFAASVALVDFDGDGNLDLAVLTAIQSAALYLGDGFGGFTKSSAAPLGYGPSQLLIADYNGDGIPDIATAEEYTPYASVLFTGPGGKLKTAPEYPSGIPYQTQNAIAVDLNNDGKPDVVTVAQAEIVSVLLGSGNGGAPLVSAINISLPGTDLTSLVSGDLNGDGKPDLALADLNGTVQILLGNGDGTFQVAASLVAAGQLGSIAEGDFNGDGKLDLAVGDQGSSALFVYLGKGDGTFQPPATYHVPSFATYLAAGDFNGDGRSDLVVAVGQQAKSAASVILLANLDGTFQPPITITDTVVLGQVVLGDVNGDGKLDAVFQAGGGLYYVFLGNGDGSFKTPVFGTGNTDAGHFILVDLNGDGNLDLASTGYASNAISVLLGDGTGRFSQQITYGAAPNPYVIVAADVNADRRPDLITLENSTYSINGKNISKATYTVLLNTTP